MANLLALIFEFGKIGLFAVGGGLASLPFLYELTDKYTWYTEHMLMDMIAISESTPGAIGINMATYVGFETAGFMGALLSTIALAFPAFIIVMIVAKVLERFKTNEDVQAIFYGLRPAVTALIAAACLGVAEVALLNSDATTLLGSIDWMAIALTGVVTYLLLKFNKHPAFYIIGCAIVGVLLQM